MNVILNIVFQFKSYFIIFYNIQLIKSSRITLLKFQTDRPFYVNILQRIKQINLKGKTIMRIYFILTAIICVILLLLPLAMTGISRNENKPASTPGSTQVLQTDATASSQTKAPESIKVLRVSSGKVIDMEIYKYIIGAVSSEIPPTYEKEAIKAQAVACYTYALWLMKNADSSALSGADISDSSETHQGFLDENELKDKWGDKYEMYSEKIRECVNEVLGQYMTYDGEPIIACYHAISPGKTENALTVWGKDIAYLKSVTAPGDALSPNFDASVTLSADEFKAKAKTLDVSDFSGKAENWVKVKETSDCGFVSRVEIAGKDFDGNDVRSAFSLRSPYFTVNYKNGSFVFQTKGYGHGLGMSQYSADYMARQGSTYKEILSHFYTGIDFAL